MLGDSTFFSRESEQRQSSAPPICFYARLHEYLGPPAFASGLVQLLQRLNPKSQETPKIPKTPTA